ncbi:DUF3871 family protein [Chryseobacterium lacus]|uniref:DUF3871 family protein n=1 Tax=Chryseobacterium lacus TaxID=2058346 RepID=A0A368MY91_9FLAO|nr:DUF3871 family protein [Chryseobacterium lacus]RCU42295.1 DUF3871 family protein [Chryseobacterium lacus]RST26593.1 DUF3871 family protein [Chryseobacterium lacus]
MENPEYNSYTPSENGQALYNPGEFKPKRSIRDFFLEEDEDEIPEAEILYPSSMNQDNQAESNVVQPVSLEKNDAPSILFKSKDEVNQLPFIVANTSEISLQHLSQDCIIPVFSKDNEKTIAHQEFIEVILEAVTKIFPQHSIADPEIRVSHQIKGRTPTAVHKAAKDLLEEDKTIYYERMAFMVKIPSITEEINGNKLSLCVGGIRSYNQENLYSKKSLEKFKFFIGFQNWICMNMCISTDGFLENLRVSNANELGLKALEVMQNYNAELHLMEMKELTQDYLSEHQFAQLIGKSRLYQHLPKSERQRIPELNFNDSHINTMAKDYYEDQNFSRMEDGRINLWNVFNLFTQANKSSYIDTFLDRNLNAFDFSKGLQKTLNGDSNYHWFLS